MTLTKELLAEWFDELNRDCFDGRLPVPRIALSHARTRLGSMTCKQKRWLLTRRNYDHTIRISTYYDCDEAQYRTTLLHEMIHYYISVNNLRDNAPHGRIFKSIMKRLNESKGWNVTVSVKASELPPRALEKELL